MPEYANMKTSSKIVSYCLYMLLIMSDNASPPDNGGTSQIPEPMYSYRIIVNSYKDDLETFLVETSADSSNIRDMQQNYHLNTYTTRVKMLQAVRALREEAERRIVWCKMKLRSQDVYECNSKTVHTLIEEHEEEYRKIREGLRR